MKSNPKPPELLDARIRRTQDECEAYLDQKAAELKAESPEVPLQVLRNLITVRFNGCVCNAALSAMEQA